MQLQARSEGDEPEQDAPLPSQQVASTNSLVPLVSGNDADDEGESESGLQSNGGNDGLSLAPPPPSSSSLPPSSASARVFPEGQSSFSTATATAHVTLDVGGGKGDGKKGASKGEMASGSFFRRRRASSGENTVAAGNADADEKSADESRLDVPSESEASSTDGESSGSEGGGSIRWGSENNDGGGGPRRGSTVRAVFGKGGESGGGAVTRLTSMVLRRRQPARVAPGRGENVEAGGGGGAEDAGASYESSSVASSASSFSTTPYVATVGSGGGNEKAAAGFSAAAGASSSLSAASCRRRGNGSSSSASSSSSTRNKKASVFDATTVDHRPRWKKRAAALVDGLPATLAISVVTVVAIFLDDLRLAAFPSGMADRACEVIAGIIFVLYSVDTVVGSLVRPGYFGRLYFWIDAVATFSMALEVPSLVAAVLGYRARPAGASVLARGVPDALDARARQITKVARILRLMRIVKLVQTYVAHQENASFEKELVGAVGAGAGVAGAPGGSISAASFGFLSASSVSAGGSTSGGSIFSINNSNSSKKKKWWTTPPKRSRVGQRLSDLSASRVVIGVLALLLAIPGFNINSGLYGDYPPLAAGGLRMLHDTCARVASDEAAAAAVAAREAGLSDEAAISALASAAAAGAARDVVSSPSFAAATDEYRSKTAYTLFGRRTSEILSLIACGVVVVSADAYTLSRGRRPSEIAVIRDATPTGCLPNPEDLSFSSLSDLLSAPPTSNASCSASMAVLDVRWNSQITATLNLVRTAFIVAALALGITLMQRDAARLVLRPMERMLSKVRAVAENPLATKRARLESRGVPEREKLMETRILENAINKICSLLAVGFGDAGAEVIAGNMRSGGELDPVVPGRRVAGIFGFCDIRQFTDATEVLQEEVMGFVNTIAKIVHREVSLHGGAPNKNIGDAFLLVWKFPDGVDDASLAEALKYIEAREKASVVGGGAGGGGGGGEDGSGGASAAAVAPGRELDIAITLQKARRLADQALASFLTIQAALRRSTRLRELTARSDVQERLPGFGVRMGFGLHVGWAIEGAIGSEYKIDASYLSPNVNMASRLEAATKQFGTSLLISGDFARLLSPGVRARTRQIDVVTVKGSAVPMSLHTYDFDVSQAPGPRLFLEEGVLQMQQQQQQQQQEQQQQQQQQQQAGAGSSLGADADAEAASAAVAAQAAAAAAAALARQQQHQQQLAAMSFRARGGRYPSRAHNRLDAAALLSATDGGDADDAETFSHRPYASEFEEHPDLATTWAVDRAFLEAFAKGFTAYRMGQWEEARAELGRTLRWPKGNGNGNGGGEANNDDLSGPPDGPSAALLRFMESHKFVPPKAWRGFRELTEK